MTTGELTYSASMLGQVVLFGIWLGVLLIAASRTWPRW